MRIGARIHFWAAAVVAATLLQFAAKPALAVLYWDTSTNPSFQPGNGMWSPNPLDARWSLAISDGTSPSAWVDYGDAEFHTDSPNNSLVTISGGLLVNSITLNGTGYMLVRGAGGTLRLVAGIIANQDASLAASVTLAGDQSWTTAAGKTFSMQGGVTLDGRLLTIDGAGNTTITGLVPGDPGGLLKTGNGTLTLGNSDNRYAGGTTIQAGTVAVSAEGQLGAGGLTFGGGVLRITSAATFGSANLINLNAGGGTVQVDDSLAVATFTGAVTGTGSLAKTGSGTLVLGGKYTSAGTLAINQGTLKLQASNVLSDTVPVCVAPGATLDLGGVQQSIGPLSGGGSITLGTGQLTVNGATASVFSGTISGAGGVCKTGNGALVLAGTNAYTGNTTITAGILQLGAAGVIPSGAGRGDVAVDGTLDLGGFDQTINGLSGGGAVTNSRGTAATNTLTVGGAGASSTFFGTIQDGPKGATSLGKTGAGTLTLCGHSTYSGPTVINGGTLRVYNAPLAPVGSSQLWLDAADASTVVRDAAGFVSQWNDKSSNGHNAAQTDGGAGGCQPLYAASALVGGKPVLRFDGVNDMLNANLAFLDNSQYTIFAVEGRTSGKNGYYLGSAGSGTNQALHIGYRDSTRYTLAQYNNDQNCVVPAYDRQTFRLWTDVLDSTAHCVLLNGVQQVTTGADPNSTPLILGTDTGRIGNGFTVDNSQCYQGDLGEIMIFNTALSAGDRQTVEAYLRAKWLGGSTVASDCLPDSSPVTVGGGALLELVTASETIGPLSGQGTVNLNTATLTVNTTTDSAFGGVILGSGCLIKSGPRVLTLDGNNGFTGGTEVRAGELLVGSANALPPGRSLAIGGEGMLLDSGLTAAGAGVAPSPGAAVASATAVPEPPSIALLGATIALATLCAARRRVRPPDSETQLATRTSRLNGLGWRPADVKHVRGDQDHELALVS